MTSISTGQFTCVFVLMSHRRRYVRIQCNSINNNSGSDALTGSALKGGLLSRGPYPSCVYFDSKNNTNQFSFKTSSNGMMMFCLNSESIGGNGKAGDGRIRF